MKHQYDAQEKYYRSIYEHLRNALRELHPATLRAIANETSYDVWMDAERKRYPSPPYYHMNGRPVDIQAMNNLAEIERDERRAGR